MVFRRSERLPKGHVSVVSRVVSPRTILVTHANWMHGVVAQDQPVADISPENDWSLVRVWWAPISQLGATTYPVLGFIFPDRPLGHDAISARTAQAARLASEALR
jgi:surface antigen